MIRITGGELRGRRLRVPEGIRPTTELARKAVFDILGPRVVGAAVLDAAAGSGAFGIEALSRGAAAAVFVEADAGVARGLQANLESLGLERRSRLVRVRVGDYLARGEAASPRYDVVFFDPPYGEDGVEELRGLLNRLAPGGVLFHERGDDLDPLEGRPTPADRRRYGRTRLLVYRGPQN